MVWIAISDRSLWGPTCFPHFFVFCDAWFVRTVLFPCFSVFFRLSYFPFLGKTYANENKMLSLLCRLHNLNRVGYARTNLVVYRTSFVLASVRSSIHWNICI
jgi:hypothetical protein